MATVVAASVAWVAGLAVNANSPRMSAATAAVATAAMRSVLRLPFFIVISSSVCRLDSVRMLPGVMGAVSQADAEGRRRHGKDVGPQSRIRV